MHVLHALALLSLASLASAQATTAPAAPAGAGASPAEQAACLATGAAALQDACFSGMMNKMLALSDVMYAAPPGTVPSLYEPARDVVKAMCSDQCARPAYRNTTGSVVGACAKPAAAEMAKMMAGSGNTQQMPAGAEALMAPIVKKGMWFSKDLVCLKESATSSQLCSIAAINLAEKYKLVQPSTTKPANSTKPAAKGTTDPLTAAMPAMMTSTTAVGALVVPALDAKALATVPKAELCTPCSAAMASQVAAYTKADLIPLVEMMNKTEAEKMAKELDAGIEALNKVCGAGFATTSAALQLGTDPAIDYVGQKFDEPKKGGAGAVHALSAGSAIVALVGAVAAML